MKNKNLLVLLVSIFCSCRMYGQNDSTLVHKYSDTYVEINVLGRQWDETSSDKSSNSSQIADGIYMQRSYMTVVNKNRLKNGTLAVKDKNNKLLDFFIYADSVLREHDHYFISGKMNYQVISIPEDSVEITKYYDQNGYLILMDYLQKDRKEILHYKNGVLQSYTKHHKDGRSERYNYSEKGELIREEK